MKTTAARRKDEGRMAKDEVFHLVRRRARRIRRLLQEAAAARPTLYPARHA